MGGGNYVTEEKGPNGTRVRRYPWGRVDTITCRTDYDYIMTNDNQTKTKFEKIVTFLDEY